MTEILPNIALPRKPAATGRDAAPTILKKIPSDRY